jgi:hypothetical protein
MSLLWLSAFSELQQYGIAVTDPVGFPDVVAAGVEPEICVAMFCAVPLAVSQHSFKNVRNGTVVSPTIACRQDDDISIPRFARIAIPAVAIARDIPVPFRLRFEVARLRSIVVGCDAYYCFAGGIVSVVVDWYIAKESEEDYEDCNDGNRQDYGPRSGLLAKALRQGLELGVMSSLVAIAVHANPQLRMGHSPPRRRRKTLHFFVACETGRMMKS